MSLDKAREGMIANAESKVIISRNLEGADPLAFGKPVSQGTADTGCHLTKTGDTAVLGVSVRDRSVDDEYKQYDSVRVMTKGVIWVKADATVAAGDDVYVTVASAAFGNASGAGNVKIEGARYDSSGAANALVKVRLG